jgi:hypothetical protein
VYGENKDWDFWRPLDEEMIRRADEVWVLCLKNWEKSRGVAYEIGEGKRLNKPILYIHIDETDEQYRFLPEWTYTREKHG